MKYLIILVTMCNLSISYAQNINWNALDTTQTSITYLNVGYDYGASVQLGHARQIRLFKPLLLSSDYSIPMGGDITDDFKIRIGGQMPVYNIQNFHFTVKLQGVFRHHQTDFVRMASFGYETSAIVGFYKAKWHLAGEFGFDKAAVTYLNHADFMQEMHPAIQDGWYKSTGGNFFYGIQASRKMGDNVDINLRMGATNARSSDEDALLPFYFQIGLVFRSLSKCSN
ncbi:MAG: hypothetical protein AB8F95_12270 [Bacteroidia bacterium]